MNQSLEPPTPVPARPATILIVEDSPVQAELLRRAIEGGGYQVLSAANGALGLEMVRFKHPSLVVSDINMPEMDGYAMCHAIRSDEALCDIPVILLTMLSNPTDVIHGLNAGADAYLTKPYNIPSLLARIESLLTHPPGAPPFEERRRLEARLGEETFIVRANGARMLSLLLSTYENAVLQNRELAASQQALESLNQELERRVEFQTAALRVSAQRLRTIFDRAPIGIAESTPEGRFLTVNPGMCLLTGYTEAELLDRTMDSITHPDDHGGDGGSRAGLVTMGSEPIAAERRYISKDGPAVWVNLVMTPVLKSDGALDRVITIAEDISERKRSEQELVEKNAQIENSLEEKEALLREIHHRVKNNLQVIASLLRMEGRRIGQPETRAVLRDMQDRIHSMALIHETLYRSDDFSEINLAIYLRLLAKHLSQSLVADAQGVSLVLDVAPLGINLDQAMPCGLIVSELVSNAMKHGFPKGRSGTIRIELRTLEGGALTLGVSDDGVGLPPDFEARRAKSLGLQLVADLSRQLRGELTIGPGSAFRVTFAPQPNRHRKPASPGVAPEATAAAVT